MSAETGFALVGVFDDPERAREAFEAFRRAGFRQDQLGFLQRGEKVEGGLVPPGAHAGEGAAAGAAVGGSAGLLWGLAVASGLIPGIGPVIAGGTLAAIIITSAAAGATMLGLVGFLVGLGIPESEARYYEEQLRQGHFLLAVRPDGRIDEAAAIFRDYRAATAPEMATPY